MSWRVARSLNVLLRQINDAAPRRSKVSDGSIGDTAHSNRTSDHNPDPGGVVRARDFTHDPASGFDAHAFAERLRQSRDSRIKYVISNGRIFAGNAGPSPWTWRKYYGSNPHTKHAHVSVISGASADYEHTWSAVHPGTVGSRIPPIPNTPAAPVVVPVPRVLEADVPVVIKATDRPTAILWPGGLFIGSADPNEIANALKWADKGDALWVSPATWDELDRRSKLLGGN